MTPHRAPWHREVATYDRNQRLADSPAIADLRRRVEQARDTWRECEPGTHAEAASYAWYRSAQEQLAQAIIDECRAREQPPADDPATLDDGLLRALGNLFAIVLIGAAIVWAVAWALRTDPSLWWVVGAGCFLGAVGLVGRLRGRNRG